MRHKWTKEELELLQDISSVCTLKEIAKVINRKQKDISNKITQLNLLYEQDNPWSIDSDESLLIGIFNKVGPNRLQVNLGASLDDITSRTVYLRAIGKTNILPTKVRSVIVEFLALVYHTLELIGSVSTYNNPIAVRDKACKHSWDVSLDSLVKGTVCTICHPQVKVSCEREEYLQETFLRMCGAVIYPPEWDGWERSIYLSGQQDIEPYMDEMLGCG